MKKEALALYLVTDRGLALGRDLETVVMQAVKGGVTLVQLREKDIDTREFIALGQRLKAALTGSGVPLLINDRVDVALAVDADGVHIGQSDMPYDMARLLLGPDKIIGLSVETMEQVVAANALDVDYVAVSPIFATKTKTDTLEPFGYEGLRQARALSRHPLCGIGGMNAGTAGEAIASGADGVAVVSAIMSAPDPYSASINLRKLIENELDKRSLGRIG
jgi:thiamine-phosphate pyrophosphorylase